MLRLLIVEDDRLFSETLSDFFEEEGFEVVALSNPQSACELLFKESFDFYIFDIKLPFQSGLELLKSLRDSKDKTPALILTSYSDKEKLVKSFEFGADDFLTKPVDLNELKLRVNAILNRSGIYKKYKYKNLTIYPQSYKIEYNNKEYILSKKPFKLLKLLVEAKGEVVTFEMIENTLWNYYENISYIAIRIYITKLKKIFKDKIKNIRGIGYKLEL